ncbi:hypothetical protein ACFSKJ_21045 [Tabrizicola soli]|uniref:hypothetical protein n=1 Tax=Tabrizicola soli TaxID=2185115 RepID=UPI0036448334
MVVKSRSTRIRFAFPGAQARLHPDPSFRREVAVVRLSVLVLSLSIAAPVLAQVPAPEGTTAIAIGEFTGTGDAETQALAPGFGDLILTDAVQMLDTNGAFADCPAFFVEWKRRKDLQAEIDLQQREEFDPATRIKPGQLIDPSIMVTERSAMRVGRQAMSSRCAPIPRVR